MKPVPVPDSASVKDVSPVQFILNNNEVRLGTDEDEYFKQTTVRIVTPEGLKNFGSINLPWNPETETLTFHRFQIIRNGKTIDLLGSGKKVTVIRRETGLEAATLDGQLTATVQPEGLQVGDLVELAFTLEVRDPAFHGRSDAADAIFVPGTANRVRFRFTWPDGKSIRWRATYGMDNATLSHSGALSELIVDRSAVVMPKPPRDAPLRFNDLGQIELTQFASWAEVSAIMAPLYARAEVSSAGSPVRGLVEALAKQSARPKLRAEAALRLVQDQVHYVYLGMNFGGYNPAAADLTWSRRFGDCKGKTALLLALLHGLGIDAEPVLASTAFGDGLNEHLPRLRLFDHVLVRAVIDGKVYWLDGTRTGDRDLDEIPTPDFRWVLPVRATGAALVMIAPKPFDAPAIESIERIDASAGYDVPAPAHLEEIYRGDLATAWRLLLVGQAHEQLERTLKDHWRDDKPWIEPKTVDYASDETRHELRLTMDGTATLEWTRSNGWRAFEIGESNLGFESAFKRDPGPHADAPFSVPFPSFTRRTVQIVLPFKGSGFELTNAPVDVDETIAARRFIRHTRIDGGQIVMVAEERSLASEFPFSEAAPASAALRKLSEFDVRVRGPDSVSSASEFSSSVQPTTAADFNMRGAADLHARNYEQAVADFTQAAKLEPGASKHIYDRGAARFEMGQDDLALEDFNAALRLNPNDLLALLARADLHLFKGAAGAARQDFQAARKIAPANVMVVKREADAFDRSGFFKDAARAYDALIAQQSDKSKLAPLLNARCWVRAEWGSELEAGLADCDAALELSPADADFLDSRGLIWLRLGQYRQAIDDYTAALRLAPGRADSLFGRGLAKASEDKGAGAADLAAARAADAGVDRRFARLGLRASEASR